MPFAIYPVLCRTGKMDNYSYILADRENNITIVIDPSEAAPIIAKLDELELKPDFIFNTHHHFDHTDANLPLKQKYSCKVVGNEADKERIPEFDIGVESGQSYAITPPSLQKASTREPYFSVIDASAHTQGHVLYYFPSEKALFTGDTLFNLSIGGLFEGTAEQMFTALQTIKSLPQDTLFYAGHEYTAYGAREAFAACDGNKDIQSYLNKAQERLSQGLPAGPFSLKEEIACNPYLRAQNLSEFKNMF